MQSENRKKKGVKKNEQSLRSVRVAEREKKKRKRQNNNWKWLKTSQIWFFFLKKGVPGFVRPASSLTCCYTHKLESIPVRSGE